MTNFDYLIVKPRFHDTPTHLIRHAASCCDRLDIDASSAFARVDDIGNLLRATRDVIDRLAAYYLARAWHLKSGRLSYPEVAESFGLTAHSSIVEGVQKFHYYRFIDNSHPLVSDAVGRVREAIAQLQNEGYTVVCSGGRGQA